MGKLIFMRRFWEYGKRMKIRKLFEAAGDRIENIIGYKDRNRFLIAVFVLILFIVACGVLADPDPNADNNLLDILQRREVK